MQRPCAIVRTPSTLEITGALVYGLAEICSHVRPKLPSVALNGLLCLVALGVSLCLGEIGLRMTGRFRARVYPPTCDRPDLYQRFDPYGYRLWPSRTTTYLYPQRNPRRLTLVSNRHGFRSSRELDEPDARRRIVVLGDSFVFGEGVEESERFTNVLETLEPTWRIDNLGMTGYGPDLMLRALEEVGLVSSPRVVVLAMYTDDFRRVRPRYAGAGFPIPRFQLESGRLITIPHPQPDVFDRLSLVVALNNLYWRYTSAEFDLNAAIFDRFLQLAKERAFAPVIMFLPGTSEAPVDRQRRNWLRLYAQTHATPFLDLSDPISRANPKDVFIPGNWHWNPRGHAVAAAELQRFLSEQTVSPP